MLFRPVQGQHPVSMKFGTDGVLAGGIVGTYLHGPVLPRNPANHRTIVAG